jgi:DNA-binding NtrC family response regulator
MRFATSRPETVLVVEPSELVAHRMRSALRVGDRQICVTTGVPEAVTAYTALKPELVLVNIDTHALGPAAALEPFVRLPGTAVIAVCAEPTVAGAIAAVHLGAADVLGIRDDAERIRDAAARALSSVRDATARASGRPTNGIRSRAPSDVGDRVCAGEFAELLTWSPRMLQVFDQVRRVAPTDATALILGETGTGKELVSRAIHDQSERKDRPFVPVNCGAFTDSLLESELFGHERGSFTGAVGRREGLFEAADGGTLFLDELGETSPNVQVNLLRVLEEMAFRRVGGRELVRVDVRIIAATNLDLEQAVADGRFRQDLFHRLNVFPIHLPPLCERREDILLLMRHFLDELATQYKLVAPEITTEATTALLAYRWPGNVRQLRSLCERWVIANAGAHVSVDDLPADMRTRRPPAGASGSAAVPIDEHASLKANLDRTAEEIERGYLLRVLRRNHGHLGRTATAAGITRRTLYTKMKQFGWQQADFRS